LEVQPYLEEPCILAAGETLARLFPFTDLACAALLLSALGVVAAGSRGTPDLDQEDSACGAVAVTLLTPSPGCPRTERALREVAWMVLPTHACISPNVPMANYGDDKKFLYAGDVACAAGGGLIVDWDVLSKRQQNQLESLLQGSAVRDSVAVWSQRHRGDRVSKGSPLDTLVISMACQEDELFEDSAAPTESRRVKMMLQRHIVHAARANSEAPATLSEEGMAMIRKYFMLARTAATGSPATTFTTLRTIVRTAISSAVFHKRWAAVPYPDCALAIALADQSLHSRGGCAVLSCWGRNTPPTLEEALQQAEAVCTREYLQPF